MGTIGKWNQYLLPIMLSPIGLWALSDCGHYRNGPDTIARIRLWALSECGLYRRNTIVGAIGMWSLSDEVNQGRFCRTSYASWQLWTADLGGVPQIPILNRKTRGRVPDSPQNRGARKTHGWRWSPQNLWVEPAEPVEGIPKRSRMRPLRTHAGFCGSKSGFGEHVPGFAVQNRDLGNTAQVSSPKLPKCVCWPRWR